MNFLTLFYFVETAKEMNFSKTAHKLHMSQQTLSFHIQKLEEYYGSILFIRKPQLRLTYAGEVLLQEAEEILAKCDITMDRMSALSDKCAGRLKIGISHYPARVLLPKIIPVFHKKWPNVRLYFPNESMVKRIKSLLEGNLDLCIGIYNENDPNIISYDLYDDNLYLVVSNSLLESTFGPTEAQKITAQKAEINSLAKFSSLPFMVLTSSSHLGSVIDNYMNRMKVAPRIILESGTLDTIQPLVIEGIAAFICGRLRAGRIVAKHPHMVAFPLATESSKAEHHFKLLLQQGAPTPEYLTDFIHLTKEAFQAEDADSVLPSL